MKLVQEIMNGYGYMKVKSSELRKPERFCMDCGDTKPRTFYVNRDRKICKTCLLYRHEDDVEENIDGT